MIGKVLRHNLTFFLMAGVLIGWLAAQMWPASYWLRVHNFAVFDGPADADVIMSVDREIRRPFEARRDVLVREIVGDGTVVVCLESGSGDYRVDAALPSPLTLKSWTNGQCPSLPPGKYLVSTIWHIDAEPMPAKVVRAVSNVFDIQEIEE